MKIPAKSDRRHIDTLPTSVIDVVSADQRRELGLQDNHSSRQQHSNFFPEISDLVYQLYLHDSTLVFDPFSGWGERADGARRNNKHYHGIDINPAATIAAETCYGVHNCTEDALKYSPPFFDAVFTCPPYWNLERYSGLGLEESPSWEHFIRELQAVFYRLYEHAPIGAKFCIVCGDWRKDKVFYDMSYRVQKMFEYFGAVPIDKVIISRKSISKIKIMIPQAVAQGYTVKVHEYLFVYRKAACDY